MIRSLRHPLWAALALVAASAIAQQCARKQILVLGTFHFASNQDAVKHGELDILGTQRQAEVQELNDRLAGFAPDRIMVEWKVVEDQPFVDSAYAEYLADRFTLRANEVYQIGFRQARRFDTGPPQCIDADGLFLFDTLNYAAGKSGSTAWFEAYMDSVVQLVMEEDSLHMHQRITEALRRGGPLVVLAPTGSAPLRAPATDPACGRCWSGRRAPARRSLRVGWRPVSGCRSTASTWLR